MQQFFEPRRRGAFAGFPVFPLQFFIRQIFRRIGRRHIRETLFETALRHIEMHAARASAPQPIRQKRRVFRKLRHQDFFRYGYGIRSVKFFEKPGQKRRVRLALRIRNAVIFFSNHPPVANIKNFQRGVPPVSRKTNHVEITGLRDDVLPLLYASDRLQTVTELGRRFKIQILRRRLHFFFEPRRQRRRAPFKNIANAAHDVRVFLFRTKSVARRGAIAEMVLQARPLHFHTATGTNRIFRTQKAERFLQPAHIGERAEIMRPVFALDVSRDKHARPFFFCNFEIRIAFVVAKGNIVFRMQLFDEAAFQNQRLHLRPRHRDVEILGVAHHRGDFRRAVFVLAHIGTHAIL